jgi:hypothetical protein
VVDTGDNLVILADPGACPIEVVCETDSDNGCRAHAAYVTLFVFRVTSSHVSAHECLGDCSVYVGEVTVPRPSLPWVRPGDRVQLRIA